MIAELMDQFDGVYCTHCQIPRRQYVSEIHTDNPVAFVFRCTQCGHLNRHLEDTMKKAQRVKHETVEEIVDRPSIEFEADCRKCLTHNSHILEESDSGSVTGTCGNCGNLGKFDRSILPREIQIKIGGYKDDADKPLIHLIPVEVLLALAKLYTLGAKKYRADNWKEGADFSRWYNAMQRHLWAWWLGEELDPDNHQHHLDSVIWNAVALRYFVEYIDRYRKYDDRPNSKANKVNMELSFTVDPEKIKMNFVPYGDEGKKPEPYAIERGPFEPIKMTFVTEPGDENAFSDLLKGEKNEDKTSE